MSKKYSDLVVGDSLCMLKINPYTYEIQNIINCTVDGVKTNKNILLSVRYSDKDDKSIKILHFRVNPDSYISKDIDLDSETYIVNILFETEDIAIEKYINFCENKIKQYENNILKVSKIYAS